ncbi:hypothetical protein [Cereibacter sediminicola]|uniref:hypothetical protein n=1 Tax=Cereibacter sediminicola TaxID=2584941 RepID=UPI003CCC8438
MENAFRANPLDIREQYEKQLKDLQEAYGAAMLEAAGQKKAGSPHGAGGRQLIRTLPEGLLADGLRVPLTKLCAWFGVPRRTVYYKPTKAAPKVDPRFAEPIKALIEKEPSFGYRTVAWLLGFNSEAPNATGPCERAERPSSGSSRSRAGKFASARSGCDPGSRRYPRWRQLPTSAGPRTSAGSGPAATAGPRSLW